MYGQTFPASCETCDEIVRFFDPAELPEGPGNEKGWGSAGDKNLGQFKALTSGKCEHHARLFRNYLPSFNNSVDRKFDYESSDVYLQRCYTYGACFIYLDNQRGGTSSRAFTLLPPRTKHQTNHRHSDPSWIDMKLLEKWKNVCDTQHKECANCNHQNRTQESFPSYLINLESCSIVDGLEGCEYWALSYVWGNASQLHLSTTTIDDLQLPGSLEEGNIRRQLPLTIRHAMALARTLGCGYLWVDSLCIVQNDDNLRSAELSKMSSIFAQASVVIVAANGLHANHGLLGLRDISGPRDYVQESTVLRNGATIIDIHLPSQNTRTLEDSSLLKWKSRGWTFQESLFARRKLIFYDGSVGWECSGACNLECVNLKTTNTMTNVSIEHSEQYLPLIRRQMLSADQTLDIDGLSATVSDFNSRDFTYPEDVLDAFSGVVSFLHSQSHGTLGFVSGLPGIFFNLALLWHDRSVRRRSPSRSGKHCCLPSWSWAGWKDANPITYWKQVSFCEINGAGAGFSWQDKVYSSIQWKGRRTADDKVEISIHNSWDYMRDRFIDNKTEPTPTGWTRHLLSSEASEKLCRDHYAKLRVSSSRCSWEIDSAICHPRCYYTHESHPNGQFLFPLSASRALEKQKHLYLPFISCVTSRVHLEVGNSTYDHEGSFTNKLHDKTGILVGALDIRWVFRNGHLEAHPSPGSVVELVEVAQGVKMLEPFTARYEQPFPELQAHNWPTKGDAYEYVWVLGIHWENGIAYRDSIGRVMKDKWDKLEKDEINLILG
jgi:hypothetical protein